MEKDTLNDIFKSQSRIAEWGLSLEQLADEKCQHIHRNGLVVEDVYEIFSNIYKGKINIILYGSRITGLTTKDKSDIDMLIDTSGSEDCLINCPESENWLLRRAAKFVREHCGEKWTHLVPVLTCRTPVLKMFHKATQMHCDITVMSKLGVSNTKMMCLYLKHTPYLRQVILVVREWSIFHSLEQDLHNYTISLLVLFYFQVENYAASVKDLKFECSSCDLDVSGYEYVDFDNVNYRKMLVRDSSELSLYEILLGFFEYYSTFDFESDVVCPLIGHPIKKKLFEKKNLKKLPKEMHKYKQKVKEGDAEFKLMPMCVQDPLDLSHNLIKKPNFIKNFRDSCLTTVNILKQSNLI